MSRAMTVVVDYGAGNLKSVENALRYLGARFLVTANPADLSGAEALIFPGVGEAAASMAVLERTGSRGGAARVPGHREKGPRDLHRVPGDLRPVGGALHDLPGPRARVSFEGLRRGTGLKVPHMGWNAMHFTREHPVFAGYPAGHELLLRALLLP